MSKKRLSSFLVLLVLVWLATSASGQDTLPNFYQGNVMSQGKPVAAVSVIVEGKRKGVVTDENGGFTLNNISRGKIKLHFLLSVTSIK